jgi:uncharacterized membrane protein
MSAHATTCGRSQPLAFDCAGFGHAPPLRSRRERLLQTVSYETGGMLLATPAYAAIFGARLDASFVLLAAIVAVSLAWCPAYNTIFDWVELRRAGRVASDRPHRWRAVHAISFEASVVVAEVPVIMGLSGHGLAEALAFDIGLGAFYAGYSYVFYLGFDRLRPVAPGGVSIG